MKYEESGIFIPAKCEKTGKDFFVESYQAYDGTWVFAYGVDALSGAKGDSHGNTAASLAYARSGPQFSCPYCGQRRCFMCCVCGKITCYDGNNSEGRKITCGCCGASLVFDPRSDSSKKINFSGVSGSGQR